MKRKSIVTMGIIAAMGVTALAGCSGETKEKPLDLSVPANAKELAESVLANMENITSLTLDVSQKYSGDMSVSGYTMGSDVTTTMAMKQVTDGDDVTGYTDIKTKSVMSGLKAMGASTDTQEQEAEYEMYTTGKKQGGTYTNYVKTDDTDWTKYEVEVSQDLLKGQNNLFTQIVEGKVKAELAKDTVKVNNKEAYEIDTEINGEMFQDLLGSMDTSQLMDLGDLELDKMTIPVTVYVYKDTKYPAKIDMDAKEFGEKLYNAMMGSMMSSVDMKITLNEFDVEYIFDNYNSVEKFTIPQDVIDAAGGSSDAKEETSSETTTATTAATTASQTSSAS